MNMRPLCDAVTQKKAWRNPLAPHARCKNEATVEFTIEGVKRVLCTTHARAVDGGRTVFCVCACGRLTSSCSCSSSSYARFIEGHSTPKQLKLSLEK